MKSKTVWTVSQDGGKSVCAGYAGKDAKRVAMRESGGGSRKMAETDFKRQFPTLSVITLN